jgi:hypothetical protein
LFSSSNIYYRVQECFTKQKGGGDIVCLSINYNWGLKVFSFQNILLGESIAGICWNSEPRLGRIVLPRWGVICVCILVLYSNSSFNERGFSALGNALLPR